MQWIGWCNWQRGAVDRLMRAIGKMCSIGVLLRVRAGVGVRVRVRLQVVVRVVVVVVAVADDAAEVRYTDEKEEKSSAECGGQ